MKKHFNNSPTPQTPYPNLTRILLATDCSSHFLTPPPLFCTLFFCQIFSGYTGDRYYMVRYTPGSNVLQASLYLCHSDL